MNLKKNPLLTGTLILTFAGIISRGIGFLYRLFISQAFGEENMGLFQLISPVIMIAFSLTGAGMQTAISRYTASCVAIGRPRDARRYLWTGIIICTILSAFYSVIIYGQADPVSVYFFKEPRLAPLLRITALSFPLTALHSCLNGYFYGIKEVRVPAFTQLAEQLVRTGSVFFLYLSLSTKGQPTIALAALGMVLGEVASCSISYVAYQILAEKKSCLCFGQKRAKSSRQSVPVGVPVLPDVSRTAALTHLLGMAIPLSCNRLIVNLLQSVEAVSIPEKLKVFGYSTETALSIYGVLTGMAFSLVLFPSAFTQSASVLLLPEVTQAASSSHISQMRNTIRRSILASIALGVLCSFGFFLFGSWAGKLLFDSQLAGTFIRQLSFLCPFLYLHATLSSILHGLKKTGLSLVINVVTLLIRLGFIIIFIPQVGIAGYLWGLLCSELLSTVLYLLCIKRVLLLS